MTASAAGWASGSAEAGSRGDFFYVSARYRRDRSHSAAGRLAVFDSRTLRQVKSIAVDVPAGVFSRTRAMSVVVGLQEGMRLSCWLMSQEVV